MRSVLIIVPGKTKDFNQTKLESAGHTSEHLCWRAVTLCHWAGPEPRQTQASGVDESCGVKLSDSCFIYRMVLSIRRS